MRKAWTAQRKGRRIGNEGERRERLTVIAVLIQKNGPRRKDVVEEKLAKIVIRALIETRGEEMQGKSPNIERMVRLRNVEARELIEMLRETGGAKNSRKEKGRSIAEKST